MDTLYKNYSYSANVLNRDKLNPENTYQLHWRPSTTLMCFQFEHLLNLTNKFCLV